MLAGSLERDLMAPRAPRTKGLAVRFDPRRLLIDAVLRRRVKSGRGMFVDEYIRIKQQDPDSYLPPTGKPAEGITVSEHRADGMPVFRLTPKQDGSDRCFVYLHGGSFVGQIVSGQWGLVMELVRGSGSSCMVPIYPLAPAETAAQTTVRAARAIGDSIEEFGAENVSVLGDSAGGTIAVSAVQLLRDASAPLPSRLILLAPWLDLAMTHPDQAEIEEHDILVRRPYLLEAAKIYAGDLPMDDPRVSPLHGNFAGLPPMFVFTGSHDVVATDSRELVRLVGEAGGEIEYVEAPRMQHAYPIYPLLAEARDAKKRMAALLAQQ